MNKTDTALETLREGRMSGAELTDATAARSTSDTIRPADLASALLDELPAATSLRRDLHAAPDLTGQEASTRDLVLSAMGAHGLGRISRDNAEHVAETGAAIRVGGPGPAIAVRAELDALAVTEETGVPWASARAGRMHACGHDVHMAALVALSRAVARMPGLPPLLAVLQPREESYPSGGQDIARSGVFRRHEVTSVIGAHVQPTLRGGVVAATPGPVNAAADEFSVTVAGAGGHAAYPHLTRDPVLALASIVVDLQHLVSRGVDPVEGAIVSVSTLAAGTAPNVVPDRAVATGTLRSVSRTTQNHLHQRLSEVARHLAQAHGCRAEIKIERGEPVLCNDPAIADRTLGLVEELGLTPAKPLRSFGSDDFSFLSEEVPGLMMFVGVDAGDRARLHGATFLPPDQAVHDVAMAMLAGYLSAAASG
ncbi:M20 metallopeptidase family protein [Streptomyces iranensis]|uniref:Amidohydrolase n=2 Tax=Streptomyces iranensis TaxID=576784 RepID=A0ABS4MV56_9ACTN|nr:M20 family metallopeptidase [Streptomyces iranensis]MBP2063593.1 amidohydrolase [Streptomyces iranensis]